MVLQNFVKYIGNVINNQVNITMIQITIGTWHLKNSNPTLAYESQLQDNAEKRKGNWTVTFKFIYEISHKKL